MNKSTQIGTEVKDGNTKTSFTSKTESTSTKKRDWCFTIHMDGLKNLAQIKSVFPKIKEKLESIENVKYLIAQIEKCPKTGKYHIQGYLQYINPIGFKGAKARFEDDTVHIEPRKGTHEQARDYCKKSESAVEGTLIEIGDEGKGQGARSDLAKTCELLEQGKMDEIENDPVCKGNMIRYNKHMENYIKFKNTYGKKRNWRTRLYIIWGVPGAGKSYLAKDKFPNAFRKDAKTKWWCNYKGEENVIIDDFDPSNTDIKLGDILLWSDEYPCRVEVKGGDAELLVRHLVITTNFSLVEFYEKMVPLEKSGETDREKRHREDMKHRIQALSRRISSVKYLDTKYQGESSKLEENKIIEL